jgi:hypothetical protein
VTLYGPRDRDELDVVAGVVAASRVYAGSTARP